MDILSQFSKREFFDLLFPIIYQCELYVKALLVLDEQKAEEFTHQKFSIKNKNKYQTNSIRRRRWCAKCCYLRGFFSTGSISLTDQSLFHVVVYKSTNPSWDFIHKCIHKTKTLIFCNFLNKYSHAWWKPNQLIFHWSNK